jgi:ribosomal protein S18 acetylase RimI-like enzyme
MSENRGTIKIRKMDEKDLASVNAVDHSISGKGRVTTWPFSFETYWRIYQPKIVFVAELNGEVSGFISGYIEKEERSKYLIRQPHELDNSLKESNIGWIEMMGVRPDCWHKGIGRRLIEAFNNECKKINATMRIIVRDDDEELTAFLRNVEFRKSELTTYEKSF